MICAFATTCRLPFASGCLLIVDVVCRYPPKLIPGCHIMIHTTATTDQDARLLLTQIGIPFFGKLVS